jgi:adenine C2-methylase RlmN of 23S rRNA A2503 and tRNA A37
MVVNIRKSRGKDIDAACGQLARRMTGEIPGKPESELTKD